MQLKRHESGFTFIEMLVVAVLVSVLATIGMVSYTAAAKHTRDARRKQDADNIRVALESYRQATGAYPQACGQPQANTGRSDLCTDWIVGMTPDYMSELSSDPTQGSTNGHGYEYIRLSDTTYRLVVYLENADDPLANGDEYGLASEAYVQEEPK